MSKRFAGKPPAEWTFQTLYTDLLRAHKANRADDDSYPPDCTMLAARCIDILRQEERRPQRIRDFEEWQKAQNNG